MRSMQDPPRRLSVLRILLSGFAMGTADLVPGVSGGTIALIVGVYDGLLSAIASVNRRSAGALLTGKWQVVRSEVDFGFILPLALGILTAVFVLSEPLGRALESPTGRILLFAFFFGLVVGSVIAVGRSITWSQAEVALGVAATIGAFLIVRASPTTGSGTLVALFAAGFVAVCAMVLPGISGSFILLLMGQYERILNAVRTRDLVTVAVVAGGAVIGVLSFARMLRWLLGRFRSQTLAALTGFMAGSLWKIWPWRACVTDQPLRSDGICAVERLQAPDFSVPAYTLMLIGLMMVIAFDVWERRRARQLPLARPEGTT